MTWFKVDDSFESHPKVKGIPRNKRARAVGLWTLAGSWSARQLTDGFVPIYMLDELACTAADARALVAVGLWIECDGGFRFNDWHDWQPTREKVEAERSAARERMRAARERKKADRSSDVRANNSEHDENFGERSGEVRSTQGSLTPTRPDPTRPVVPDGTSEGRGKRARRLPDDFAPKAEHEEIAQAEGVDLDREFQRFVDYWQGNGKTKVDWDATLRNWLRSPHAERTRRPLSVARLPHASELEAPPNGLTDEQYDQWLRERAR